MRLFIAVLALLAAVMPAAGQQRAESLQRVEEMRGKKILFLSPHPDDDTFCCGGMMALLAKNGNDVRVALYTNDDKGSYDEEMTQQRLARIRKAEEEAAVELLGIPKKNVSWFGYNDGELEYVPQREIVERTAFLIRQFRPDVLFAVEPGQYYERWHKSDHRMAAFAAIDGVRAAEFRLYFPNHELQHGLKAYKVPLLMFFYAIPAEENYWVNIDSVLDLKIDAAAKHVSQFEPSISKYRPDWEPQNLEKLRAYYKKTHARKDGRYVEGYRQATGFNQK